MDPERRANRPRPRWRRWIRRLLLASLVLAVVGLTGLGAAALWALTILPQSLPSVTALEAFEPIQGTRVFDENDELISELQVERRIFVPLASIPKTLRDAIVATEDVRFYSHYGVDPTGIARAIYQNFRRGRIVEGGSTITQQLAKVLFLTPDKSLDRKIKEAFLALELERRYDKDRILELYLNHIYFGAGAFGVEAAARTYFGKPVAELDLAESALLAGLPKAPTTYSPFERAEAAKRRRAIVLARMAEVGLIPPAQAKRLAASGLGLVPPERRRTTGQYYLEYVQQYLEQQYGADIVFKGGLQVYTTLSPTMQLTAERAIREGLKAIEARRVKAAEKSAASAGVPERPEGALIAIEPQTGYVKAMVGGYDFLKSEFNRAVRAHRQVGSAFKPFVYIAALESGLTPASVVDDTPIEYPVGRGGKPWKPENYDRKFRGPITFQLALEESVNVAAVKVQEQIGLRRTMEVAHRLGIESPLPEDLTLALGSSDLTLIELASAYAALANQGTWVRPTAVRYVVDAQGKLLEENTPEGRQALSPELAYVITHMLRGAVERGTAVAAKSLGRPIAGKTGTTNDYSNAWFVGFTPSLATAVWVGYDRPRPLGRDETGARAALPIWMTFMSQALAGTPIETFAVPEQVVILPVDLDPNGACLRLAPFAFLRGTQPAQGCQRPQEATSTDGTGTVGTTLPGPAVTPVPDGALSTGGATAAPGGAGTPTPGSPVGAQSLELPPRPAPAQSR
jgi:penicillin-binding protein 1A